MAFGLTFWGVRGTVPCPAASHLRYGGNTSCLEVVAGDQRIILDAGTGLRLLGKQMAVEGLDHATLLLSHTHLDHISGFPFFQPAFQPGFNLHIVAGHLNARNGGTAGAVDIGTVLARQMERPLFPIPMRTMGCNLSFEDIVSGDRLQLGPNVVVTTAPLNHPDGATAYRIEHGGRSLAYVTDTEHFEGRMDVNILALIRGADLFIYDSTYTEEEYPDKAGWGHSTWEQGVALAEAAGVEQFVIFHHEPDHDDDAMAAIERAAADRFPRSFAAREGMIIRLA